MSLVMDIWTLPANDGDVCGAIRDHCRLSDVNRATWETVDTPKPQSLGSALPVLCLRFTGTLLGLYWHCTGALLVVCPHGR